MYGEFSCSVSILWLKVRNKVRGYGDKLYGKLERVSRFGALWGGWLPALWGCGRVR